MLNKILVITEGYPSKSNIYNMSFVHSRNTEYLKLGTQVDVISFSARKKYTFEGINVYSPKDTLDLSEYTAVLSHAPNLRNHFRFIFKNFNQIKKVVLFFHGHEILITDKYYPSPYSWQKKAALPEKTLRRLYDQLKTSLIRSLLYKEKVSAIFVSNWMLKEGLKNLRVRDESKIRFAVINNSINDAFYSTNYKFDLNKKKADFITIRPLDGRKYAVDKVVELANNNPKLTFHIYGKGLFFKFNTKPSNVQVFDMFIEQKDIPSLLNHYKCAVMPTRLDAQGVMMCEMASYGIPTIVSDLPVCREMLSDFANCIFINNDSFNRTKLSDLELVPLKDYSVIEKFSPQNLAKKELNFIFNSR